MKSAGRRILGFSWAIGMLTLVVACSQQPRKVDCEGRLEPINSVNTPARQTLPPEEHRP